MENIVFLAHLFAKIESHLKVTFIYLQKLKVI